MSLYMFDNILIIFMEEEFGKFSKRNILSLNLFVFSIFTLFDCIISLFGFEMLKI